MSKQVPAEIGCPQCGTKFKVMLFRSLWIEDPANRALVEEDRVNAVTCPSCKTTTRLEFPFLCTNVKRGLAIWYEPYPDPQVDKDVLLYKKHFGPNSFYAKAPRIRSWDTFKTKLLELEALTDPTKPHPKVSAELSEAMPGFIKSFADLRPRARYPRLLSHLETPSGRTGYAFLPILLLIGSVFWRDGPAALGELMRNIDEVLLATVILTSITFAILTVIHLAIVQFKPWRERSKMFRAYCFFFACWFVAVSVAVLLFDPFDYGGFRYMGAKEVMHLLGVSLLIPVLIGVALYSYERFVR